MELDGIANGMAIAPWVIQRQRHIRGVIPKGNVEFALEAIAHFF
jgi:hypothetical protein